MAAFTKIQKFVLNLGNGGLNLGSDQLVVALTNTLPVASTANVIGDITEISYTNCSSRNVTTTSYTQTSGTAKLLCAQLTLTATGTVGPFEWVVLYDSTPANKYLIGFWDYGSAITLANTDTFLVGFDQSGGVLTIA